MKFSLGDVQAVLQLAGNIIQIRDWTTWKPDLLLG
jgi:hypothetical protein